ncbi:MAG: acetolactate decarboxylase [Candidatus Saganbacteria bacterium]|nr:acetolactate decarboxylase [Candidatus Saganbacteria bacterium]
MKNKFTLLIVLLVLLFVGPSCIYDKDVLFQYSILNSLYAGNYDGIIGFDTLSRKGNFGIGTFDKLDGEMICLDGIFYQVKSDGKVSIVKNSMKCPFAQISFFAPQISLAAPSKMSLSGLASFIDSKIASKNLFYAVKITGEFEYVKARSVPPQKKPYPPLTEVVKTQSIFELKDLKGTLVGYRYPDYIGGINSPGYHFHFLDDTKTSGGHILDLTIKNGTVSIDGTNKFYMELPADL